MLNFLSNIFDKKKKEFQEYGFREINLRFRDEGEIQFAQWLHPGEMYYEIKQEHIDFFKQYIKRGDFVIDIGANQGDTTVPMALASGAEGTTLGLEPNPNSFKVLAENSKLNKTKTNVVPLNFAATNEDGTFTFGSGDPSFGNGGIVGFTFNRKRNTRYTFQVTGKNLQNYLSENYSHILPRLTFIKIDTEGYDKEIIKSIEGIITQYRPYLVAECFGPSLDKEKYELYDVLASKNYTLYYLNDFDVEKKEKLSREEVIGKKTFNILAIPKERE